MIPLQSTLHNVLEGRQKYGLRQFTKRLLARQISRTTSRVDRNTLREAFEVLGVKRGMVVCVHSSMQRLGYVAGGARAIIEALMEAVGADGGILMPTFSMRGSMADYLKSGAIFDVRSTPSSTGQITETFRTYPGVVRSCHPTHSVAAWGKTAKDFIRGHEESLTPFGHDTPYGRLAARNDSYILMLETHILSLLHHLQERLSFPNLFFPEMAVATVIDADGLPRKVSTKMLLPRIPYYVAIPGNQPDSHEWITIWDFCLIFPGRRTAELERMGCRLDGYPPIQTRREDFTERGILSAVRLGKGEAGLLHVRSFLEFAQAELGGLIKKYRYLYTLENIEKQTLPRF